MRVATQHLQPCASLAAWDEMQVFACTNFTTVRHVVVRVWRPER